MEEKSKLLITDWPLDFKKVEITQPDIVDYYFKNINNKKVLNDFTSIKYLYKKGMKGGMFRERSKQNEGTKIAVPKIEERDEIIDYFSAFGCDEISFHTTRTLITKIMLTRFLPYSERPWTIYAEGKQNAILLLHPDDDQIEEKPLAKQYELFKRHLFVKKPEDIYNNIFSIQNPVHKATYSLKIGNNDLYYVSEFPGVVSDEEVTYTYDLKKAEQVYCDVIEYSKYDYYTVFLNNPKLWAEATLVKAKNILIGLYNGENLVEILSHKIDLYKTDLYKFSTTWSPDTAWNFLDSFLTFAKNEIQNVDIMFRHEYIWKFTCYDNNEPYILCEIKRKKTLNKVKETELSFLKVLLFSIKVILLLGFICILHLILHDFGFFMFLHNIGEYFLEFIRFLFWLLPLLFVWALQQANYPLATYIVIILAISVRFFHSILF